MTSLSTSGVRKTIETHSSSYEICLGVRFKPQIWDIRGAPIKHTFLTTYEAA